MAGGTIEKSAGIPVIEVGVPTKKDRGDLYAKSLQGLDEQGLVPEQKINPNPKKEISPELRKEINSNLSAAEKQSLEYLKLKALNVQTAIEKAKGPHNAERGAFVVEKKGENKFSLTSFGQTTEFGYEQLQNTNGLFFSINKMNFSADDAEEMIRLVNFINFSKDFIKDNIKTIAPSLDKNEDSPFYKTVDNEIRCYSKAGMTRILKGGNNFFPKSTKMIVDYLNHLYKEEIKNQKVDDKNRLTPFPPK